MIMVTIMTSELSQQQNDAIIWKLFFQNRSL